MFKWWESSMPYTHKVESWEERRYDQNIIEAMSELQVPLKYSYTYYPDVKLDNQKGYVGVGTPIRRRDGQYPPVGYYFVESLHGNNEVISTSYTKVVSDELKIGSNGNYYPGEHVYRMQYWHPSIVTSSNRDEYPDNGFRGMYYYIYAGIENQAPAISGSNLDLGSKQEDFEISYTVSDPDNNSCTVDIVVDTVKKVSNKNVVLNTKYTYPIKIDHFTLGRHTVTITAKDSNGATSMRKYTFTKSNTAPTISGRDTDLGEKSTAFTENYMVTDKNNDDVAVTITLDDSEIATVASAQDKDLSFTITDSQLLAMEIGSTHTVTIKADDGKGGVAYRRYTFTKINRPPIISGSDADLGQKKTEFTQSFSFTDVENDKIYCRVYLDGRKVYENLEVVDSKTYSYRIPHEEFIQLRYGKHEIKIEAWDDYSVDRKVYRVYSFERISNGLEVEVKINEFNVQPKKIIAVPHGIFASDAIMKIYACNNYMDSSPTWEDISAESKAARAHAFTSTSKSNSKWSIGIKVIVENGKSGVGSVLRGIKGGYE